MRIAILGLGYVGTTTAACLAKSGHHVLGIDISPEKVALIGAGRSPVVEPQVEELLAAGVAAGRVRSALSIDGELDGLDMVIICVGTPSRADGKLDLSHLLESTRQLGHAIRSPARSPAAAAGVPQHHAARHDGAGWCCPTLERAAGEPPGQRWEAAFNPEFLRESTAVKDYFAPPKIVIGEREQGITGRLLGIYDGIDAPLFEVPLMVAEMGKFVDNSWHAVKVAFANEIGRVAIARGIDPQAVAEIFLADTKLNVSPYYLRPGGPYGGSCLPKDLSGHAGARPRFRPRRAGAGRCPRQQRAAPRLARPGDPRQAAAARADPAAGPVVQGRHRRSAQQPAARSRRDPGRGRLRPLRLRSRRRPGAAGGRQFRGRGRAGAADGPDDPGPRRCCGARPS